MNKNTEYMRRYRQKHPARAKAYAKKYRETHAEKISGWKRKDRENNKDAILERTRKWRATNPEKMVSQRLRQRYRLSKLDYEKLVKAQNGVCAICGNSPNGHHLFIDHNHETGTMRGLLCRNCNFGLGLFDDNIDSLLKAAQYLMDYKKG